MAWLIHRSIDSALINAALFNSALIDPCPDRPKSSSIHALIDPRPDRSTPSSTHAPIEPLTLLRLAPSP